MVYSGEVAPPICTQCTQQALQYQQLMGMIDPTSNVDPIVTLALILPLCPHKNDWVAALFFPYQGLLLSLHPGSFHSKPRFLSRMNLSFEWTLHLETQSLFLFPFHSLYRHSRIIRNWNGERSYLPDNIFLCMLLLETPSVSRWR